MVVGEFDASEDEEDDEQGEDMRLPRGGGDSREKAAVNLVSVFCEQVAVVVAGERAKVVPARQHVIGVACAVNLEGANAHCLPVLINHVFGPNDLDGGQRGNHVITGYTEGRASIIGRVHAEHDRKGERVGEAEDAAAQVIGQRKQVSDDEQREQKEFLELSHCGSPARTWI